MNDFKEITSKENSLIKLASSLQSSSKSRLQNGLAILEGLRICDDACDNGIRFDKLIVSETAFQKYDEAIDKFAHNADECYRIPDSLFKKISDTTTPQGICAICQRPSYRNDSIQKDGRYIALENVSDPSNLGAVSRTAEALGATGILLSSIGCDPYSPKALRASMGTLLRMPVFILNDFVTDIANTGLDVYACVVDKSADKITDIHFSDGCVLMIGNEANGLTDKAKAIGKPITIPMNGKAESLNAAVAAAISVWEMMRNI